MTRKTAPKQGRFIMSFASRLSLALPLLAAVMMTPAGNAATACPDAAAKAWKNTLRPAMQAGELSVARSCPQDCSSKAQPGAPEESAREAHVPLPLSIVTRAEDVADWHADIFQRLRGERFEDGPTRYCGIAPSTLHTPL
jgi:hypothetical protein